MAPYLAALLSALLMWAAFPPLDLGWLAFVAPVPVLWALRRVERAVEAVAVGFLFGAGFYGALLYWIYILGAVAWIPLTLVMGAMVAAYGVLVWAFRLWPAWRWWLISVGGWALLEFLRSRFPFGGFPWGNLGYAAGGKPGFIGAVQWIGPSGWTVLAVALAAGLVLLIEDRKHWRFAADAGVVIVLLTLAGSIFAPSAQGQALRVAIVQGGTPCPRVHCQNEKLRILERHLALTDGIPAGSVDLVVWAENSTGTPYDPESNDEVRQAIVERARALDAYFLVSGTRSAGPEQFLNVNVVYSPDGVKVGEYVKRHPVPFGEFVPLRGLLGFIPQLEQVPRDMVRGKDAVVFTIDRGLLGSVISFEGAFARSVRSVASGGSQVLVVATNEASFGRSPASDQLIGLTKVNAAAVGQDLVHAAITGRSAYITASGDIISSTDLYEETVLFGNVRMSTAGPTLYTRLGDWVLYLALVGMIFALGWPGKEGLGSLFGKERFVSKA